MSVLARVARALLRVSLGTDATAASVRGDLEEEHRAGPGGLRGDLAYLGRALRLAVGYGVWRRMRRRARVVPPAPRRVSGLGLDVRQAARGLLRRPGHVLVAVVTLGVGIGADTAIFSVAWHALLRPLPFAHADRALMLFDRPLDRPDAQSNMNIATFLELRARSRAFDAMSAFEYSTHLVGGALDPAQVGGLRVNAGFFSLLGLPPHLGRDFRAEDDRAGAPPVVILSHGLWRDRFGADPGIVGRTVAIDLVPHEVVGVAAPPMVWRAAPQLWTPWAWDAGTRANPRGRSIFAVARLAPGVAAEAGRAELATHFADVRARHPEYNEGRVIDGRDLTEWTVGWGRRFLLLLLGAAGLVLLVACVNVANLMLARAAGRQGEVAVRRALGASRFRASRIFLVESLLVALPGAALGVLIALAGVPVILALWGGSIPRADAVAVSGAALGFACAVAILVAIGVGLAPLLMGGGASLRATGRGAVRPVSRLQSALVVMEVAVGVVLVAAAGLLAGSAARLAEVDLGIAPGSALSFRVALPGARYGSTDDVVSFFAALRAGLGSLPGVSAVGLSTRDPLSAGTNGTFLLAPDVTERLVEMRGVSPGWFEATGQRLLAGRALEDADGRPGVRSVVVNRALVDSWLGDGNPIGRTLRPSWVEDAWTIVGVVSDVRDAGPTQPPRPTAYFAFGGDLMTPASMAVLVRAAGADATALIPAVRERVRTIDADVPISGLATLGTLATRAIGRERTATLALIGAFAGIAVLLALLGIYAVIAFIVEQRRREIGVRVALGASRGGILRLVCFGGVRLAGAGVLIGLAGALVAGRLVAHLLWNVSPVDPVTLGTTGLLFLGVALAGSVLPARRAAGFSVADMLRQE